MAAVKELLDRWNALKEDRLNFDNYWQELADYMLPNKADFLRLYGQGEKRRQYIFSGVAEQAREIFANSVMGFLANPATRWFTYATLDEDINRDHDAAMWLDLAGRSVLNDINQSGAKFYGHFKSCMDDIGTFGITGMSVLEGISTKFQFTSINPKELYIAENMDGTVDLVNRPFEMTCRQLIWARDKLGWSIHPEVEKMARHDANKKTLVLHALYPRDEDMIKRGRFGAQNMPVASCYIDIERQLKMSEGGFREMPLPVGRWDKASGEVYARSPGMVALADAKMLNIAQAGQTEALEKELNPPLQVPHDGVYGRIDLTPGAINSIDQRDGRGIVPIVTNGNLNFSETYLEQLRGIVRMAFYVDQLQLVGTQNMTATEVLQRQDEKGRLLAPSIGRLQGELVGPIVERCLSIKLARGELPTPPPALQGQEIKVVYLSPLSRAQRSSEAKTMVDFIATVGQVAPLYPDIVDNIDLDAWVHEQHAITGPSPAILRPIRDRDGIRKQRQQQQEAQQMLNMAQQGADTAKMANDAGMI